MSAESQRVVQLSGIENGFVAAKSLVEFAKIFAAVMRILRADFALDSRQRVKLRGAAARSKIGGRCHSFSSQLRGFTSSCFLTSQLRGLPMLLDVSRPPCPTIHRKI